MIGLFQGTFAYIIPLMVVSLGALISEKSGVTNIAMEGLMVIGGFFGVWFLKAMETSGINNQLLFIIALIIGGIVGGLFSLIHAVASIKLKADQIISATAINLMAPALYSFIANMTMASGSLIYLDNYSISSVPLLGDIPIFGQIFFQNFYISTVIGFIILAVVYVFLYKSKMGLRIRACGENPHAADSLGIKVEKLRFLSVSLSGVLAGVGGVILTVTAIRVFSGNVLGYGFLAIAVLIFGNWKPSRILLAAVFFGLMSSISGRSDTLPILRDINIQKSWYLMLPYLATLIVLVFASKNSAAPKAVGKVYEVGER